MASTESFLFICRTAIITSNHDFGGSPEFPPQHFNPAEFGIFTGLMKNLVLFCLLYTEYSR